MAIAAGDPAPSGAPGKKKKAKRGLFEKMAVRSFFAVVMGAGLAAVYFLGHAWLCALVVAVQVGAFVELTRLQHHEQEQQPRGGLRLFRSLKFAWLAAALYAAYGMSWMLAPFEAGTAVLESIAQATARLGLPSDPTHYHDLVSLGLFAAVFCVTVLSFQKGRYREQLSNISWTLTSLLVVVFQMKSAIKNIHHGVFWLVFPMALVIINDTMAYFSGVTFGRRFYKGVFMELSPNKTLEGFVGGGLFTLAAGFVLPGLLRLKDNRYVVCSYEEYTHGVDAEQCAFSREFAPVEVELASLVPRALRAAVGDCTFLPTLTVAPVQLHGLLLAAFASTVAPFGGFLASAIKRAYNIKDFSDLIPEHGGVVDRMDCQFIMALATLVYFQAVVAPRIGVADASSGCVAEEACQFDVASVGTWAHSIDAVQLEALFAALPPLGKSPPGDQGPVHGGEL